MMSGGNGLSSEVARQTRSTHEPRVCNLTPFWPPALITATPWQNQAPAYLAPAEIIVVGAETRRGRINRPPRHDGRQAGRRIHARILTPRLPCGWLSRWTKKNAAAVSACAQPGLGISGQARQSHCRGDGTETMAGQVEIRHPIIRGA